MVNENALTESMLETRGASMAKGGFIVKTLGALRKMVQEFTKNEVEPQALQYNREERFNRALFERAGELGLLGVTADPEYGGAGMDATAACIVHEVPYDAPSCHDAGPVA